MVIGYNFALPTSTAPRESMQPLPLLPVLPLLLVLLRTATITGLDNGLGLLPVMGYNTWYIEDRKRERGRVPCRDWCILITVVYVV